MSIYQNALLSTALPIASFIFIAWQRSTPFGSSEIPKGDKLPRIHLFGIYMKQSKNTVGMVLMLYMLAKICLPLMVDGY